MEKFTAFVFVAIGLVYGDPDSDNLFFSLLLPLVVAAGLLYLFWYKAFLALCGALLCYHFMDLESQSILRGVLMPILLAVFALLFLLWADLGLLKGGSGYGGDGGGYGDFGGGDGGGGDGGG